MAADGTSADCPRYVLAGMVAGRYAGSFVFLITSGGIGTTTMSIDVARSRGADTPRLADWSVMSICRFFMSSTDSPNGRHSTFAKSLYDRPAAARMTRALISVPD